MSAKQILIQSYPTSKVPNWIEQCIDSAHTLANLKGWEYHAKGDEIFDLVPQKIRSKLGSKKVMLTDLARLLWAKEILRNESSIGQVIWLDADVFVFSPEHININAETHFAVGRQNWIQAGSGQTLKVYRQVHNAILVLGHDLCVADFLIYSISRMINEMTHAPSPQIFGPKLLTALHNIVGFDVIESVGMASPLVLQDIARGGGKALSALSRTGTPPLGALNLCSSYQEKTVDDILVNNSLFTRAIKRLNRYGL